MNNSVEVDTQSLSMIFGFQPTENWNIYGGAVYQTVKGMFSYVVQHMVVLLTIQDLQVIMQISKKMVLQVG